MGPNEPQGLTLTDAQAYAFPDQTANRGRVNRCRSRRPGMLRVYVYMSCDRYGLGIAPNWANTCSDNASHVANVKDVVSVIYVTGGTIARRRVSCARRCLVRDASEPEPDCGCAPTPAEMRANAAIAKRSVSRRWLLGAGALGLVAAGALGGPMLPAAFAATYPSWDDVQRAKGNEASKASEVTRVEGLINQLQSNVAATQAAAEQASMEYFEAEEEYLNSVMIADDLQAQADAQGAAATAASQRAGKVASQLYRSGGDDTSLELFFAGSASGADDLLGRLGRMDQVLERNKDTFASAVTAPNSAQSLSDQASVARDERDRLKQVAEQKMVESQAAADAAQDAQSEHLVVLEAPLAALKDQTAQTIAGYQAGVEAKRKAEEEARRRAEEEARRLAAEAAAAAAAHGGGGGGGGGGVVTRYSHIQNGEFMVGYGANVSAGQLIGREGMTGLSYGCHLHFEVGIDGVRTNPEVFMRARGISI